MSRDPDSVALEAASSIVHAVDHMTFPGGDVQLKAHIQCIVYDAIHRANTPDSAAQGAMGDELNVVWLTGILERLDEHRLTGPATLAATLFQEIEKYLPKVAQPSDAPAQPSLSDSAESERLADLSLKPRAQPRVGLTGRESIEKSIVDSVKHLTQSSGYSSLKDAQIALSYLEDVQDESGRYHLATIGSYLAGQESLANTAQGKPRNFCADCGKRTPEGSIHTCAPAYAVEQADHIVANKMAPPEPSAAMLDAAVAFALNVSLHSGYGWTDYMRDLWKVMMQANQREAHISHNSAHNDAAKKG